MRRIAGEIEKKRFRCRGLPTKVITGPVSEDVCRVTLRLDNLGVVPYEIDSTVQMSGVAVHHIIQKPMKIIKSSLVGNVRRLKPEMPLPDQRGVIASLSEFVGKRGNVRLEITPRVIGIRANHSRNTHTIRIKTCEKSCARRRAHRAVRPHRSESHSFGSQLIDVRSSCIRRMIGGHIPVTQVISVYNT